MVNGEYPDDALTAFELEDSDKVVWHYVDDYTSEEDLAAARRAADISPKEYANDRLGSIVTCLLYTSYNEADEVLTELGFSLPKLCEMEPDAGLGNGGLGRLASCYMDAATGLC